MTKDIVFDSAGLTKSFGDLDVLRGLNLTLRRGQIYGLLGGNGAGKTTAINIITGLLQQDGGEIRIGGPRATLDWSRLIGVAPQEPSLYPKLTCSENITFFARIYGLSGTHLKDRLTHIAQLLGLESHIHARVSTLSGGMRRRLNLAIAIVHSPELLILDEPTAGLDIDARYSLWKTVPTIRDLGTSVLLTTHLLDEAEVLCDRIGFLNNGQIAREGTLGELRQLVPAAQVAEVVSEDEQSLIERAEELGIATRKRGARLALMLSSESSMESIVDRLRGTSVRSISLRPVGLEDVYFELMGRASMA